MATKTLGKNYRNGEFIIRQGETGDCMFVIQEGRVEVLREKEGQEVVLAELEPGDFFGEMAIFEKEVRSASVRSIGESSILTIDKRNFLRRIQDDPSLAFRIVQSMSSRIRKMSETVAGLKISQWPWKV